MSNEEAQGKFSSKRWGGKCKASGGCIYGLGFLGAAVYYIQHAEGFWLGVLGVLKAIVWPGILTYELFKFLGL